MSLVGDAEVSTYRRVGVADVVDSTTLKSAPRDSRVPNPRRIFRLTCPRFRARILTLLVLSISVRGRKSSVGDRALDVHCVYAAERAPLLILKVLRAFLKERVPPVDLPVPPSMICPFVMVASMCSTDEREPPRSNPVPSTISLVEPMSWPWARSAPWNRFAPILPSIAPTVINLKGVRPWLALGADGDYRVRL